MKLVSMGRITKLGVINFWRNGWLSLVNTIILAMTLIVICIFVIFNLVIDSTTQNIKEKINVSVYLNDEASVEQINQLIDNMKKRLDVRDVEYVSKEEALARWRQLQITQNIKEQISEEENPLPRSIEVKANNPESLDSIVESLNAESNQSLIRSISYQQNRDIIQRLISITKFSQRVGLVVSLVFVIISILVILNTVRLTVFTRKSEIEIMKIVGAKNSFIDFPFIVESTFIALFAATLATLLLWLGMHYITEATSRYLGDVSLNLESYFYSKIYLIFAAEFIMGSIISIGCTLVSIRRHLRV